MPAWLWRWVRAQAVAEDGDGVVGASLLGAGEGDPAQASPGLGAAGQAGVLADGCRDGDGGLVCGRLGGTQDTVGSPFPHWPLQFPQVPRDGDTELDNPWDRGMWGSLLDPRCWRGIGDGGGTHW